MSRYGKEPTLSEVEERLSLFATVLARWIHDLGSKEKAVRWVALANIEALCRVTEPWAGVVAPPSSHTAPPGRARTTRENEDRPLDERVDLTASIDEGIALKRAKHASKAGKKKAKRR